MTLPPPDIDLCVRTYLRFRFFAGYDHGDATGLLAALAHLYLDKTETRELFNLMVPRLVANRQTDEFRWGFSARRLVSTWRVASDAWALQEPFHVYALRHHWSLHDQAARLWLSLETQHCGRRQIRQGLQRCERHGRTHTGYDCRLQPVKARAVMRRCFFFESSWRSS